MKDSFTAFPICYTNIKLETQAKSVTCLIAKAAAIKETMEDSTREQIYEFGKFLHVCCVGLDNEIFTRIEDRDFDGVVTAINLTYAAMKG